MGGRLRKPPGTTVRTRDGQRPVQVQDLAVQIPPKPRGLPLPVRRAWDDFWASDVAMLIQRSDLNAVRRLFQLYSEREACHQVVTGQRRTRVPLSEALKVGLEGELVHELDDEGKTHSFVAVAHDGRVGLNGQGQMVLSPWARDLRVIDAEIRQLEDRFGLNVKARVGLAVLVQPRTRPDPPAPPTGTEDAATDEDTRIIDQF